MSLNVFWEKKFFFPSIKKESDIKIWDGFFNENKNEYRERWESNGQVVDVDRVV
jgi:hypothetical protein